jgi:acyl-CoA synthetase (AMP-forming)/AMP-acid ligase II
MDDVLPSFFARLGQLAKYAGDRLAVSGSRRLSFAELHREVIRGIDFLADNGIEPGATIGISIADEVTHMIAALSLLARGAVYVTVATFDPAPLRQRLCDRAKVGRLLVAPSAPTEAEAPTLAWRPTRDASAPIAVPAVSDSGDLLLRTSGTTGDINLVRFSQTQMAAQAVRHPEYKTEALLRLASIEHNNSKRHRLYCVYQGGTNVFRPEADVSVEEFCRSEAVTCLDISRVHASDLLQRSAQRELGLGELHLRTGGSSIPQALRHALVEKITPSLFVRYAATECGAIAMAGPGEHDIEDNVGRPAPGVVVEIVDSERKLLPAGEIGEIRLKAPGMATGYVDNPEASAERFRDGWFYPGDVGSLSTDGQLRVHGRRDDMMILNGLNIFPAEIERALEQHPSVRAAAALPVPSAVHGQIPVAAVEVLAGAEVTGFELQQFAQTRLGLRAPRRVQIVRDLPRTSQGKLAKREIAKLFGVSGA